MDASAVAEASRNYSQATSVVHASGNECIRDGFWESHSRRGDVTHDYRVQSSARPFTNTSTQQTDSICSAEDENDISGILFDFVQESHRDGTLSSAFKSGEACGIGTPEKGFDLVEVSMDHRSAFDGSGVPLLGQLAAPGADQVLPLHQSSCDDLLDLTAFSHRGKKAGPIPTIEGRGSLVSEDMQAFSVQGLMKHTHKLDRHLSSSSLTVQEIAQHFSDIQIVASAQEAHPGPDLFSWESDRRDVFGSRHEMSEFSNSDVSADIFSSIASENSFAGVSTPASALPSPSKTSPLIFVQPQEEALKQMIELGFVKQVDGKWTWDSEGHANWVKQNEKYERQKQVLEEVYRQNGIQSVARDARNSFEDGHELRGAEMAQAGNGMDLDQSSEYSVVSPCNEERIRSSASEGDACVPPITELERNVVKWLRNSGTSSRAKLRAGFVPKHIECGNFRLSREVNGLIALTVENYTKMAKQWCGPNGRDSYDFKVSMKRTFEKYGGFTTVEMFNNTIGRKFIFSKKLTDLIEKGIKNDAEKQRRLVDSENSFRLSAGKNAMSRHGSVERQWSRPLGDILSPGIGQFQAGGAIDRVSASFSAGYQLGKRERHPVSRSLTFAHSKRKKEE